MTIRIQVDFDESKLEDLRDELQHLLDYSSEVEDQPTATQYIENTVKALVRVLYPY